MHWVNEHEKDAIQEEAKADGISIGHINGKKESYMEYVRARYQEDISDYLKTLDSRKWKLLEQNIYLVDSLEELKELLK